MTPAYTPPTESEVDELLAAFSEVLRGPSGDGQVKRAAGIKPHWTVDPGHEAAFYRHLGRKWNGEDVDPDSGARTWGHIAWRACALGWQEEHAGLLVPQHPRHQYGPPTVEAGAAH